MRIKVLFFAVCKDLVGSREVAIDLPDGASVADLRSELVRRFPVLDRLQKTVSAAVNCEFAVDGQVLHPGDEVALIPPVSGGADRGT